MPKVLSRLPNMSESVNGVAFVQDRGQWISEEVGDDVAAHFGSIPGYSIVAAAKPAAKGKSAPVADGTAP